MKAKLLIFAILVLALQIGCESGKEQDNVLVYDQISYREINKPMYGVTKDSVSIGCYSTIFEIQRNTNPASIDSFKIFLKSSNIILLGDCGIEYFVTSTNKLTCLFMGNAISQHSQWYSSENALFSLEDFKGKGEKYIGFRTSSISNYPNQKDYCYGWVCIELNAKSDSLKIIDFALNETKNKSIMTGQTR